MSFIPTKSREAMIEEKSYIQCPDCKIVSKLSGLPLKMGGLLCPKCRRILLSPKSEIYDAELKRRNKEFESLK